MKQAITKNDMVDVKDFPTVQITYMERVGDAAVVGQYGHHSSPPKNSACLLICVNGDEGNKYVIPLNTTLRQKGLKEGEVVQGNFKVGSLIFFDKNGNITITGKANLTANITTKTTINCPNIDLGQATMEYIVKATKLITQFNSHVHKYMSPAHPAGMVDSVVPTVALSETDIASDAHRVGD
jgi:phage gp45-like